MERSVVKITFSLTKCHVWSNPIMHLSNKKLTATLLMAKNTRRKKKKILEEKRINWPQLRKIAKPKVRPAINISDLAKRGKLSHPEAGISATGVD